MFGLECVASNKNTIEDGLGNNPCSGDGQTDSVCRCDDDDDGGGGGDENVPGSVTYRSNASSLRPIQYTSFSASDARRCNTELEVLGGT